MPIFRVKSVKIYTGQKKFTRIYPWDPRQIRGMHEGNSFSSHAQTLIATCTFIALPSKRQVRGACSGITQVTTK